jgi:hypothetical protein
MTLKTSSSLLFLVFFQIFSVKAQYCTPSPTTTAEGEITNVVLMGATYGISNFTTCPTVAAFENYTSVDSANVIQGSSYTATITISPCGGFALDPGACEAWIDWNQNGVYNTNESIGSWTGNIYSSNKTATFNFTVPVSASVGRTRLRILLRQGYGAANTPPLNPCTGGFTYGAVEDYTIQVQAVPSPCPGPTSPSVGVVSDSSAVIYWNSTQSSFDVEYGLAGFTPGSGTSQIVFNDTLFLASLTAQTNYQYYVRSNCTSTGNGTSAWLGPIPFTTACVVQSMPYLQTFSSWPVPCFDTIGGTFSFKRDSISSSAVAYMDGRANSDNAILISPAILISTDAQLEFTWSHHKVT